MSDNGIQPLSDERLDKMLEELSDALRIFKAFTPDETPKIIPELLAEIERIKARRRRRK